MNNKGMSGWAVVAWISASGDHQCNPDIMEREYLILGFYQTLEEAVEAFKGYPGEGDPIYGYKEIKDQWNRTWTITYEGVGSTSYDCDLDCGCPEAAFYNALNMYKGS